MAGAQFENTPDIPDFNADLDAKASAAQQANANLVTLISEESEIPFTYANITDVIVGASDVSILFGVELLSKDDKKLYKFNTRIVLTHDHFMRMMDFWSQKFDFLCEMYNGRPKNLFDIAEQNKEKFDVAVNKYFNTPEKKDGK